MLNFIKQAEFKSVPFDETSINVHQHDRTRAKSVVVFVHGFTGSGYKTWGSFPKFIFSDESGPPRDVAVYRYSKGIVTLLTLRPKLGVHEKQLARSIDHLQDRYEEIYFVAHSLGGLLAIASIRRHLQAIPRARDSGTLTSVSGVFLFGTPRAGSRLAIRAIAPVVSEFEWLAPYSEIQTENEQYFTDHVDGLLKGEFWSVEKFYIPRLVCIGMRDKVVTNFSSTLSAPYQQIEQIDCNHRSLVKPKSANSAQVRWLISTISSISNERQERRSARHPSFGGKRRNVMPIKSIGPGVLVTELWFETENHEWERIYNQVCQQASTEEVAIVDAVEVDESAASDMVLSLHLDSNILSGREEDRVRIGKAANLRSSSVGIAAIGGDCDAASDIVREQIVPDPEGYRNGRIYISGVFDAAALRVKLQEWLELLVSRRANQLRARNDFRELRVDSPRGRISGE
ncbi:alpha/beta hydrolase [Rhodococcus triatomae]